MGPPRRGGPSGRCHSWLELTKRHKQLRRLIPIYFPGKCTTFLQPPKCSDENIETVASSSSPSIPTEPSCTVDTGSHCSATFKAQAAPGGFRKRSLLWNIDEHETSRLHGMMNASLIFKSLSMSPIHWKCVPQLCSLRDKHCASICGVIIRKRRRSEKVCDVPPNFNDNECKSATESKLSEPFSAIPLKEINAPQQDPSISPVCSPLRDLSGASFDKAFGRVLTKQEELPVGETAKSSSIAAETDDDLPSSSLVEKENVCLGSVGQLDAPHPQFKLKPEPYASTEPVSVSPLCKFCSKSFDPEAKRSRKICSSCTSLFQRFIHSLTRVENFICLHEIPCSVRWPLHWVPSADVLSENVEKRALQELGPFADNWCIPCKVAHCVKMGCNLTVFCSKRSSKRTIIKCISADKLNDLEFQHRGRERFAKQFLDSLLEDYGTLGHSVCSSDTTHGSCEDRKSTMAKFLDSIWARPVYLPSRSQLCASAVATHAVSSSMDRLEKPVNSSLVTDPSVHFSLSEPATNSPLAEPDVLPNTISTDAVRSEFQDTTCDICSLRLLRLSDSCSASSLEVIKSNLSRHLVQNSLYELTFGPARVHRRMRIHNSTSVASLNPTDRTSEPCLDESQLPLPTLGDHESDVRELPVPSAAQQIGEPDQNFPFLNHATVVPPSMDGFCSEVSVSVCGPCLRQLRLSSQHFMQTHRMECFDPLSELMLEPLTFCQNLKPDSLQPENTHYFCLERSGHPLCDHCHLYKCLTYLYDRMKIENTGIKTHTIPGPGVNEPSETSFVLPIGGPFIIPPYHQIDKERTESLFAIRILPRLFPTPPDEQVLDISQCACCCFKSDFLSHYKIGSSNHFVCSGCLWTYKEGIISISTDNNVRRVAKRLASAAAATNSAVPLLSVASQRTLLTTARLAQLLSAPCTSECSTASYKAPLWIMCPACTFRRCHRLLPISLPLHHPRWYRHRVKLLQQLKSLEDLDPRLLWCQSKPVAAHAQTCTDKVISHRLALVDIEYTTSMIERWLTPPEPPTSTLSSTNSTEPMSDHLPASSDSGSDEEFADTAISDSSSDSSTSCFSLLSNHESEYGGSGWWSLEESPEEPNRSASVAVESSATEPEMDEAAAEAVTVTVKRQRKPSLRAVEANTSGTTRKAVRCLGKHLSAREEPNRGAAELPPCPTSHESLTSNRMDTLTPTGSGTEEELPGTALNKEDDVIGTPRSSALHIQSSESLPVTAMEVSSSRPEATGHSSKRQDDISLKLIVRGKRRLKINHRFLGDFQGVLPFLTGCGRQIQRRTGDSSDSDVSSLSRNSAPRVRAHNALPSSRASLLVQKRAHARLNTRDRLVSANRDDKLGNIVTERQNSKTVGKPHRSRNDESPTHSTPSSSSLGPRVKQISRPALNSDSNKYASTLSAMVHAARLAAVGAKVPGGTSPTHAALAATASCTTSTEPDGHGSNESDMELPSQLSQQKFASSTGACRSDSTQPLPERCGQCPACCGLVQPCGKCSNCRSLQQSNKPTTVSKAQPCKELICFRRRKMQSGSKSGPRVKLPSNFPSPSSSTLQTRPYSRESSGPTDTAFSSAGRIDSTSSNERDRSSRTSVNLFDTVPGLSKQLELDAWLSPSSGARSGRNSRNANPRGYFKVPRRSDSIEVFASKPVTAIPGGDLGMRFAPSNPSDDFGGDPDQVRPAEGEIVTSDLSHHGGYAVVTTMASAPPKEICYACGSGGGQLLFCASCAEPFHFYCVERQFRPRRKDHFICRNCTQCRQCRRPAADLRCVRCSGGFHPACLPHYAPAQSSQRGNWVCPHCASCVHCGAKPMKKSSETNNAGSTVLWSSDCNKCADCGLAEARGDVCPECDRAYLPTAKQMIQCDTCQLWMHRTCTKLTADEYELIARLPAGQLNKYVVNCTVCQHERKQQLATASGSTTVEEPSATDMSAVDGADRLRSLAKDTLMDRMATLIASCRRPTTTSDSPNQLEDAHNSLRDPLRGSSRVHSALVFSTDADNPNSCDSSTIPQLDGNFDADSETESVHATNQEPLTNDSHRTICASDILIYENTNSSLSSPKLPSGINDKVPITSAIRRSEPRDTHRRFSGDRDERSKPNATAIRLPSSLGAPPTTASWLTENETEEVWTSPRFLIYRVLTRVLHRLAAHPIDSLYAAVLRRMLRWLSAVTEHLFPWLNATEMANDVRDVLRQAKGEFAVVWRHFDNCSLIELHELLCPVVARTTGRLLYAQPFSFSSTMRPWADITVVDRCLAAVDQHLRAHHPNAMVSLDDAPRKLFDCKHIIALKNSVMQSPLSHCHRPHELELIEKVRNESREERWVEHWSSIEEAMVLRNFQHRLLRRFQRSAKISDHRTTRQTNTIEAGNIPLLGAKRQDDISQIMGAIATNDHCVDRMNDGKESAFECVSSASSQFRLEAPEFEHRDKTRQGFSLVPTCQTRFYFASDDIWGFILEAATTSTRIREPPVDLDEDQESNSSSDYTSDEGDVRCCLLCGHHGDNSIEGRLLFTGADTWVHVNCALWSNEVYEEDTGQLIGLSDALRRGRKSACLDCGCYGATLICSNSHEPACTMYDPSWSHRIDYNHPFSASLGYGKAIHFACALRRRPPSTRPVFTADRSWFCSPECHQAAIRQRIAYTISSTARRDLFGSDHESNHLSAEDARGENRRQALAHSVPDDMEPISLGELLVCRRVFVPSNCFVASLHPPGHNNSVQFCYADLCDNPEILQAAYEATSKLHASPNSLAFLRCAGLPASLFVVTVGSLRVDRLGEVREASDSLVSRKSEAHAKRINYLCPINYRARRIYWSCNKLDDRVSYTLHVRQTHAIANLVMPTSTVAIAPSKNVAPSSSSAPTDSSHFTTSSQHHFQLKPNATVPTSLLVSHFHPVTSLSLIVNHQHAGGSNVADGSSLCPKPTIVRLTPMSQTNRSVTTIGSTTKSLRLVGAMSCAKDSLLPVRCSASVITRTSLNVTPVAAQLASEPNTKANSNNCNAPLKIVNSASLSGCSIPPVFSQNSCVKVRSSQNSPSIQRTQNSLDLRLVCTNPSISWPQTQLYAYDLNSPSGHPVSYAFVSNGTQRTGTSMRLPLQTVQLRVPVTTHPIQPASAILQPRAPCRPSLVPGDRTLTTPTKDRQLACQLNGLFQSLPTIGPRPTNQSPRNGQVVCGSQLVPGLLQSAVSPRIRTTHPVLPQLDGTLDNDDADFGVSHSKRSRSTRLGTQHHLKPRSGSATSTDSSASNRTSLSSVSKRSRFAGGIDIGRLSKPQERCSTQPLSNSKPTSVRKRWIEDRNRQQELATLVSKAKQANQARLYQNEVEKHVRAFRLRFSIDAVVRAAATPGVAWRAVVARVAALRERHGLPALINDSIDGWTQFGLNHRHVIFLVEQMRGAFQCYRYRFRYHWRKVDRLRHKFTPPVPVNEGCARAISWSKPRLPAGHARDPLSFLHCKANPPPRPLLNSTPGTLRDNSDCATTPNTYNPNALTALLSPNEQKTCADAARQAASLVAAQLNLPMRLRDSCVAQAVAQATGLPLNSTKNLNDNEVLHDNKVPSPTKEASHPQTTDDSDSSSSRPSSPSEESGTTDQEQPDLGSVTMQFRRLVSGSAARFLRISVHPSRIHGRGLFALRGFLEDEMVVEYMGELIRNLVCEAREVRYRAACVDCYMFRIDEDLVIDATYAGNAARFINHSCDPNCYAKVISVDDKKHIVILAKRRIYPGEELTYDYRFPKESDKLLCNCGSYNCRKYLN